MRVWGRVPATKGVTWSSVSTQWSQEANTWSATALNPNVTYQWQEVTTDANGYNDAVYVPYFASLKITKVNAVNQYGSPTPVYDVQIITQAGSIINLSVPIPT